MPYKVYFAGLATFVESQPNSRVVFLPDGRDARKDHDSVEASITVRAEDVVYSDGWEPAALAGGRLRFPIESPSLVLLSGMADPEQDGKDVKINPRQPALDTSRFDGHVPDLKHIAFDIVVDPQRAAAIAQIPLRAGELVAGRSGNGLVAELTVSHDGQVTVHAYAAHGKLKLLVLQPGSEVLVANVASRTPAFETYAMLDAQRNTGSLADIDVDAILAAMPALRELPVAMPDFPTTITSAQLGERPATRSSGRGRTKDSDESDLPQAPSFTLGHTPAAAPASLDEAAVADDGLPRGFHALVIAPSHVVAAVEFRLKVGIAKEPQTAGDPMFHLPPNVKGPYELTVSVQATGFTFRGDHAVYVLRVTKPIPYPSVDLFLTPDVVAEQSEQTIAIFYSVEGQVVGSVERTITVHLEEDDQTRAAQDESLRRTFTAPVAEEPPDLTVMIRDDLNGRLAWSFITPYKVTVPSKPIHTAIAGDAKRFAKILTGNAQTREGADGLYEFLLGTGAEVRKLIPPAFWPVLQRVATASKKETPSLLIISNEPYIPWELSTFPDNVAQFHPELAPFLGVQVCVGRWLIGDRLPPPRAHTVRHSYVLSGVYDLPTFGRLLNAEDEAKQIGETYGAVPVDAKREQILSIFSRQPAADLLHFSMHGKTDEDGVEDGLIPVDGGSVKPQMITGAIEAAKKTQSISPFVFLNACQIGAGSRILGDYGGMAAAFINGGAAGVVAPLWKIDDGKAKDVALSFYRATLTDGVSPAEAIRRARASFVKADQPVTATYLAYQFFGHPSLHLRKEP